MKKMKKFIRHLFDYYRTVRENKEIDKRAQEWAEQEWYYYYSS